MRCVFFQLGNKNYLLWIEYSNTFIHYSIMNRVFKFMNTLFNYGYSFQVKNILINYGYSIQIMNTLFNYGQSIQIYENTI